MSYRLTDLGDLTKTGHDTVIDVRSPDEFAEDHLPGAINLAVMSNQERARVGTIYTQENPFKARKIGAALVARNAAAHLEGPLANKDGGWRPLVYCWRGGQRSGSFASILSQIGWRADTLDGGYQSYRRLVVQRLYECDFPAQVILLDGNTGTAKTDVLARLPELGVQSIDLEGLAGHRGSALGSVGQQPGQKSFESRLAAAIEALDPDRPVVLEAESSRIGQINLPSQIFAAMKSARRIEISVPLQARAAYLERAYADLTGDLDGLIARLQMLTRLQGHARVAAWIEFARRGKFQQLASELMEYHYDPRYAKSREKRVVSSTVLTANRLADGDISHLAAQVAEIVGRA